MAYTPLTEKHCQLIRFFCFISDCPKMIITCYSSYKLHIYMFPDANVLQTSAKRVYSQLAECS